MSVNCKGCKGKGGTPFCAWCFGVKAKVVAQTRETKSESIERRNKEAIDRARVRVQGRDLTHMINTMEKVNEDTSGVEFLLANNT